MAERTMPTLARIAILLLTLSSPALHAQPWEELSTQQQQALRESGRGLETRWNSLTADRQAKILHRLERWQNMSDEQRDKLREKRKRWESLSPEQKQALREKRETYKKLSKEERRALRERWKTMTQEERAALRERFAKERH